MDLRTYTAVTRYMVVTDFCKIGAQGVTYDSFDDACDNFSGMMDDGDESRVYSVEFGAGKLVDITAEASALIARRCNDLAIDLPEWVYAALPSYSTGVAA